MDDRIILQQLIWEHIAEACLLPHISANFLINVKNRLKHAFFQEYSSHMPDTKQAIIFSINNVIWKMYQTNY